MRRMWAWRYVLLLLCCCAFLPALRAQAATFPKPVDDYVNDYAHVLKSADAESIRALLRGARSQTGQEITVVTVESISDFADLHDCIRCAGAGPEKRREASAAILQRLGAPFYLRWIARPVIGCALDVATRYREFAAFFQPAEGNSAVAGEMSEAIEECVEENEIAG